MSTSEAYSVAANLMFRSNVGESLPAIIEAMERLDRILATSREELGKLARGYETFSNAAVRAAERAARASQEGAERSARAQETAAQRAAQAEERRAARVESAERRNTEARERAARAQEDAVYRMQRAEAEYENRQRGRAARAAAAGQHSISAMDVQMAASAAEGTLGHLITSGAHAAMDPAQTRSMLAQDDRVGAAGAQRAYDAAWASTQTAQGTTLGKNMEAVLDLKNVTGSLDEALKILPGFAQLSAVLAATNRRQGGSGDPAFAAAKAMEILGQLTTEVRNPETGRMEPSVDPSKLQPHLEAMARVAVATNGRVDPNMYLAFAKQARVGGMNLSDEFIYEKLPAMLMAMGGDRAGTAIQSISQVFQGGRLTDKSFYAMKELGLTGEARIEGKGAHKRQVGQVFEQELLGTDPAAWAAKVHDHLINDLHMTETEAMNSVQKMSQRNTIAGFLADLMKDGAAILKEQQNIQHTASGPGGMAGFLASNPEAQVNKFHAAVENLMAAFAGPAMDPAISIMNAMTGALNRFGAWAKENPVKAEVIDATIAAGAAIAGALAAVSGAMLIYGPLIAAGRAGLFASAATSNAATGAAATGGVIAGAMALARRAALPLAGGYAVHELDSNDAIGSWVDRHVPGAASVDDWAYRKSGGWVGRPIAPKPGDLAGGGSSGPQDVRVVNPGDLARAGVSNLARQANRPDSGVGGFDSRGSIQPHVNLGLQ